MKRKRLGFTPLEIKVSNRGSNRRSKRFLTGFTMVELLTVLAIITMLVGLLMPAVNMIRRLAKETKQKAQFGAISQALLTFRNNHGDYPPSYGSSGLNWTNYCGAQKLTEALLGWDLLGFHPKSAWRADGLDAAGGVLTYDPPKRRDNDGDGIPDTLNERKGPYLEPAAANAFKLGFSGKGDGLFRDTNPGTGGPMLGPDTYVICDAFTVKKITLAAPGGKAVTTKAGTPILYYKADTSSKYLGLPTAGNPSPIYNFRDNFALLSLGRLADNDKPPGQRKPHPLGPPALFYQRITDPKVTAAVGRDWPYKADSYILISAGADGLYGTADDITNFGN